MDLAIVAIWLAGAALFILFPVGEAEPKPLLSWRNLALLFWPITMCVAVIQRAIWDIRKNR